MKPCVVDTSLFYACSFLAVISFSACSKQESTFEREMNGDKVFSIKVTGVDRFSCIIDTRDGTPYENNIEEEVLLTSFAEEEEAMAKEEAFIAADAHLA